MDGVFEAVQMSTNLVVLLSGETLIRPWCVGEIVTAHQYRVWTCSVVFSESLTGCGGGGAGIPNAQRTQGPCL